MQYLRTQNTKKIECEKNYIVPQINLQIVRKIDEMKEFFGSFEVIVRQEALVAPESLLARFPTYEVPFTIVMRTGHNFSLIACIHWLNSSARLIR